VHRSRISKNVDRSVKASESANLAEHDVLAVQEIGWCSGDEELAAIGIGTRVRLSEI